MDINKLIRKNILSLCPYSTARDEYKGSIGIFLDANESPYESGFNRYPDPRQTPLKQKISEIKGIPVENIFLGNGSDEPIDLLFRMFCEPGKDNAVAISPSYGMYAVSAAINDVLVKSVLLEKDFSLDEEKLLSSCDENTKLIFLCSPNNPSGNAFPKEQLLKIVSAANAIVVVDEAYIDFSSVGSMKDEISKYPNLVVLQTLSKAWGMAGLRLGIAFSNQRIIDVMSSLKYPYNISKANQDTALEVLESSILAKSSNRNSSKIISNINEIIKERKMLVGELTKMSSVEKVYPSDANFLLVKVDDADRLYDFLLKDGIIVRKRNSMPLCESCVRISVGLPQENVKLLESFRRYEESNIR